MYCDSTARQLETGALCTIRETNQQFIITYILTKGSAHPSDFFVECILSTKDHSHTQNMVGKSQREGAKIHLEAITEPCDNMHMTIT